MTEKFKNKIPKEELVKFGKRVVEGGIMWGCAYMFMGEFKDIAGVIQPAMIDAAAPAMLMYGATSYFGQRGNEEVYGCENLDTQIRKEKYLERVEEMDINPMDNLESEADFIYPDLTNEQSEKDLEAV